MGVRSSPVTCVVLDVGGVLMKLGGMSTLIQWTGLSPDELKTKWLASCVVRRFETGRVTFQDFAPDVIDEFNLPVGPDKLADEMRGWMSAPYDGVAKLLDDLATNHRIAFLCNVNELMWPVIEAALNPARWSSHLFLSHRMGVAKPSPEAFRYVEEGLGVRSESVRFFDDSQENINAARAQGWSAFRVEGTRELQHKLVAHGLLISPNK